jgi:hypothetical protein
VVRDETPHPSAVAELPPLTSSSPPSAQYCLPPTVGKYQQLEPMGQQAYFPQSSSQGQYSYPSNNNNTNNNNVPYNNIPHSQIELQQIDVEMTEVGKFPRSI